MSRASKTMPPVHPGEILLEEFLEPLGISQTKLAKTIEVPPRRINEIVHGDRTITANTALRLARFFGTSDGFWLNLQSHYDLELERDQLKATLARIPKSAARRFGVFPDSRKDVQPEEEQRGGRAASSRRTAAKTAARTAAQRTTSKSSRIPGKKSASSGKARDRAAKSGKAGKGIHA